MQKKIVGEVLIQFIQKRRYSLDLKFVKETSHSLVTLSGRKKDVIQTIQKFEQKSWTTFFQNQIAWRTMSKCTDLVSVHYHLVRQDMYLNRKSCSFNQKKCVSVLTPRHERVNPILPLLIIHTLQETHKIPVKCCQIYYCV